MRRKKKLKNKRILLLIIFILLLILFSFFFSNKNEEGKNDTIETNEQQEEKEKAISKLKDMNERNRMEYYLAIFIEYLEDENYESAYDLLYDEFKENYFPTLNDFEKYARKTFPTMMNIQHENIERNGDVYVLWIYISDLVNGGPNDKKKMNFVIKENDFDDFVMSFSVI